MGIIGQFDQSVLDIVQKLPYALHSLMVFITSAGSPVSCAVILLITTVLAYTHKNKRLAYAAAALLLAMPLADLFKELTKRVRPNTAYVQNMLFKTYSFPSGHAYASFLAGGFFIYLAWQYMRSAWKWLVIAGLMLTILLVGLSRIYLGAHFPSDVLGGWLLGAIVLFLVIKVHHSYVRAQTDNAK